MAIKGVNLNEKEEFILPEDPGNPEHPEYKLAVETGKTPEAPTIYYIGNLTSNDRVELGDMTALPTMRDGGITMAMRNTQRAFEVVRRGLKGWSNQLDWMGKPVPFETTTARTTSGQFIEVASEGSLSQLTNDIILQISAQILEKNGMSEATAKKSEGVSPLSADLSLLTGDAPIAAPSNNPSEDAPKKQKSGQKSS